MEKSKKKNNRSHVLTQKVHTESGSDPLSKSSNEIDSISTDSHSTNSESETSAEIIPETPLYSLTHYNESQDKPYMKANVNILAKATQASGSRNDTGSLSSLSILKSPCAESLYQMQSQAESSIYSFNSSFPPLPSQSPLNITPPSTLYSGTQDFLRKEKQIISVKRLLNSSSNSLFNEEENSDFHGFQRNKKNRLGHSSDEQYMDDDITYSSIHLQLSSGSEQIRDKVSIPTKNPTTSEQKRQTLQKKTSEPSTSKNTSTSTHHNS